MQIYNFIMAGVMYLVSIVMFWQMRGIEESDSRLLPTIIASLLILLATCLIVLQFVKKKHGTNDTYDFKGSGKALIMAGFLVLFVLFAELVGFFVVTPFFILASMLFLGQRKKLTLVLVPILSTVLVVVIFRVVFSIPLPEGTVFNIFDFLR